MKIRWIGQSGYILSDDNTAICIDPYLSDVVEKVAGRPRLIPAPFKACELEADVIICTHNHLDHVDTDAIPLMKKDDVVFLAPTDAENVLRQCGVTNYRAFDEGEAFKINGFELIAVYARHSVYAVGVIVKHGEVTMYFSGDTEYDKKLECLSKYNIDIMFMCINGKLGNMNADEAARLTKIINPKTGVPTHYGMFESNTENPEKYTSKIKCGFIMDYNREYNIKELIKNV